MDNKQNERKQKNKETMADMVDRFIAAGYTIELFPNVRDSSDWNLIQTALIPNLTTFELVRLKDYLFPMAPTSKTTIMYLFILVVDFVLFFIFFVSFFSS